MAIFVSDSFTDTSGTDLASHTGETGASWTLHPSHSGNLVISNANRCRTDDTSTIKFYYASGVPGGANYKVAGDVTRIAATAGHIGLAARMDVSASTCYFTRLTAADIQLRKRVAGVQTNLGTDFATPLSVSQTAAVELICDGDQISVTLDAGTIIGPVSDSSITAAGRAGAYGFGAGSDSTGHHLDNFTATDIGGGGGSFQSAWARGSNVILQPGIPG